MIIGTQLGGYRILEPIGHGGMGEIFLAHDPRLDRRVALKVLSAHRAGDAIARERLRREALSAAALDHPFICKIFEVGEDAGATFIAMEYVRGETLSNRLRSGPMTLVEALRIAGEIAEALEEAHAAGVVHRDLKPANIMLTGHGRVKIMDFGLAKRASASVSEETATLEQALTTEGSTTGTPAYMAPEQLKSEPVDERTDLFAFGIILCEMLIGRHPFRRASLAETTTAILRDLPDLTTAGGQVLSPGLMVLVRRLLAKAPGDRYSSIGHVRADMAALSAAGVVETEAAPQPANVIGRDAEWDQLLRRLDAAMTGQGSLVLVGGEPGIGKTHLTQALAAEAKRRGCFAATGHCYEMEGAPPYVPFIETLEYSARAVPRDLFWHYIGESASEIARLMPDLRRIYPDIPPPVELPPELQRRYLFNAYQQFVARAAGLTPIVVVLEDLHWADEATLLLLRHLAQNQSGIPLLMIGTYRDADLDVSRPFARELEMLIREKLATRLALRRFGPADVQAMLTALGGKEPPHSLAKLVFAETEGNPFFVEEVFQHLREEGKLFDEAGNWRTGTLGDLEVPPGVRLVIGRRLERLSQETRRLLTTAAVVGRSFDLRLLETLEPGDPDAAVECLEQAEKAQLVEPFGGAREVRYRFVHELVRQTLVEALSLPRRARLHARVADAIERIHGDTHVSAIAHHLYQAGPAADPDKTVDYLMRAARQASAGAAHEEALTSIDRALQLVEDRQDPRSGELSLARAGALRSLGRQSEAVEWYERAADACAASNNIPGAIAASLSLVHIYMWNARYERGREEIQRALQFIGTEPSIPLYRLLLLKASTFGIASDTVNALAVMAEAEKILAALSDPPADGFGPMLETHILFEAAKLQDADRTGREAIRRFRVVGDLWGEAEVFETVAAAVWMGRIGEVHAMLRDAIPRAERIGHGTALWALLGYRAQMHMALGDFAQALKSAQEAHALAESIGMGWGYLDNLIIGLVHLYEGRLEEALKYFRAGHQAEPVSFVSGGLSGAIFLTLAMIGDPQADSALDDARQFLPEAGKATYVGACCSLGLVMESLAILGRTDELAALGPQAEDLIAHGHVCSYSQHLFRSLAGIAAASARDWDRAETHHRIAIDQADSTPYRTAQPIARYWYADMLLARAAEGDLDRALALVRESLEQCATLGMTWHARRAEQRIAALKRSAT